MRLYHGTSEAVARKILVEGIKPRGKRKSLWKECPSRHDLVYMSRLYAPYFAATTSGSKHRWALVEVETDDLCGSLLMPDEDWVEQGSRGGFMSHLKMSERTKWIRDRIERWQDLWKMSVEKLGNCSYMGTIPVEAIRGVVLFAPSTNPWISMMATDPTITPMNAQLCGDKYLALTKWFFEDVDAERLVQVFPGMPIEEKMLVQIRDEAGKRSGLERLA